MTELEWNDSVDPQMMLRFIRTTSAHSERKRRLFVVACFRHVWHLLPDERSRKIVEAIEAAEGEDAWEEHLEIAAEEAVWPSSDMATRLASRAVVDYARACKQLARRLGEWTSATVLQQRQLQYAESPAAAAKSLVKAVGLIEDSVAPTVMGHERWTQAGIARDIFGPLLFRSVPIDPALLLQNNASVKALAESAYANPHPSDGTLNRQNLLVLADALEEAGCRDTDILAHCRSKGPHVRGCWVIDLLLDKP